MKSLQCQMTNLNNYLRRIFINFNPHSGAYPGIGQGGGGGQFSKFSTRVAKCRFPYLQRTVMERCIFACFLLIPYSYEHIGRQYTCPRLYSVH